MAKKNVLQFILTGKQTAERLHLTFTKAELEELKTYTTENQQDTRLLMAYHAGIAAGYNARKREERREQAKKGGEA